MKAHSPWSALQGDTHRLYGSYSHARLIKALFTHRNFRVLAAMRLCQAAAAGPPLAKLAAPFCKLLHGLAAHGAGMDFPWNTRAGTGLAITHGWGLVINQGATIGDNVTLFHGVTLGRRDRISRTGERITGYPVLEDEVWVGPHAVIVGGVTVGRGCRIGAGAFVTEDVPPYSVVSGNPASVVGSGCVPDVMNPAPVGTTARAGLEAMPVPQRHQPGISP